MSIAAPTLNRPRARKSARQPKGPRSASTGAVAESVVRDGGQAAPIKMDVADADAVQRTIALALERYGRLDILVNNAGIAELAPLHEVSLESWNRVIAVTLTGTFLGMRYAIPVMRAQGAGVIVNTASISGAAGDYGLSPYNAAKAGGDFILRSSDTFTIAGCPFTIGTSPHPCVQVKWVVSDQRSKAVSDFTLGSHGCFCIASSSALSLTFGLAFDQRAADTISSG